jgi:hypothetical protein
MLVLIVVVHHMLPPILEEKKLKEVTKLSINYKGK